MTGRLHKAIALKVAGTALLAACAVAPMCAQQDKTSGPRGDVAVMYSAERGTAVVQSGNFWLQGGSLELGLEAKCGLGAAVNLTGLHSSTSSAADAPISLLVTTAGPRYRWTFPPRFRGGSHEASVTAQALFGEAYGFHSLFPNPQGATDSAHAFAMQFGGAVDLRLTRRIGLRALEANWVRMQLPNSTTNVQSDFRISTGIVFRFHR